MLPFATRQIDLEADDLVLHPLSDVHLDAPGHDFKAFQAKVDAIAASPPNHRVVLNGDILDISIKTSKHFEHGRLTPTDALELARTRLDPIKDRIDLIIPGNHEQRLDRSVGLDITQQMAVILGAAEAYRRYATVLRYRFKPRKDKEDGPPRYDGSVQIYNFHGRGGGRRTGQKINMVEDLALVKPDCDIYLAGHVHGSAYSRDLVVTGWPAVKKMRHFIVTGHYQGPERYAIDAAHRPNVCESPTIFISSTTRGNLSVVPQWS